MKIFGKFAVRLWLIRRRLWQAASLVAAIAIAAIPSRAADAPPILLIVPAGTNMASVEAARAAVAPSRALLIVGAAERVPLREGVDLVTDRNFSDAPSADLVVVLSGEAAGLEEFLAARRRTVRAILFLGDSPLVKRLKGDASRGALILVGGPEAIRTLTGEEAGSSSTAAPISNMPRATEVSTPRPAAASQPSPAPTESAVRKYFSARTPTPK